MNSGADRSAAARSRPCGGTRIPIRAREQSSFERSRQACAIHSLVVPAKAGTHADARTSFDIRSIADALAPRSLAWEQMSVAGEMGPRFREDDKKRLNRSKKRLMRPAPRRG